MKHMFIAYIQTTDEWANATLDERKKFFEKMKESAKKFDLNLIFYGPPWGVPESTTMVLTSDKSLDNYFNWRRAAGELGLPRYIQSSRTVTITEMPTS